MIKIYELLPYALSAGLNLQAKRVLCIPVHTPRFALDCLSLRS